MNTVNESSSVLTDDPLNAESHHSEAENFWQKVTSAPLANAHIHAFTMPCTWFRGRQWRILSPEVHPHASESDLT